LFFVVAFEVYGASVSGTELLEAGVHRQLLTDWPTAQLFISHVVQLAQPPTAAYTLRPLLLYHRFSCLPVTLHSLQ